MIRREEESEENLVFNSELKGDAYLQKGLLQSIKASESHFIS